MSAPALEIDSLTLALDGEDGSPLLPVRTLSMRIAPGELHALVGESGSGKSLTCRAILRLGPYGMRVRTGSIRVGGVDVSELSGRRLHRFRGGRVGMIFQEPGAHLSPSIRVGRQIVEALRIHTGCSRIEARDKAEAIAERVGLIPARSILRRYPHELSGGMAQRVAIAAAIICSPELLVADEPTTALDATVQKSVLELIDELRHDLGLAVLLVSHDLAVVERYADSVTVLYAGSVAEQASSEEIFRRPRHPYTQALLRARPQLGDIAPVDTPPLIIPGSPPALHAIPRGCPFHTRCPAAEEICRTVVPDLVEHVGDSGSARVACHVATRVAGVAHDR